MAQPGLGFKVCWQVAMDISMVLVEPYIATTLATAVPTPGSTTVTVGSLGIPLPAVYVGALLVIDPNTSNQEIVSVTNYNFSTSQFTATFANTHSIGAVVIAPTFPTQAISGDPFFTQSEILSYIARAQNQFLNDCPCIFALTYQMVQSGQIYQQVTCDAIEISRIAASNTAIQLTSLSRTGNLVTAISSTPHNLSQNSRFSILSSIDPSFNGSFRASTIVSSTEWQYTQVAANSTSSGGILGLWTRLYEMSQEMLWAQNPNWRNQFITSLSSFWEDRAGNYAFGVNGKPSTNIPIEVLTSIRDTDTLELTDGLLCPDICAHVLKYRALEYALSKDGQQADPLRAAYCKMRADRVTMAVQRYMAWLGVDEMAMEQAMTAVK